MTGLESCPEAAGRETTLPPVAGERVGPALRAARPVPPVVRRRRTQEECLLAVVMGKKRTQEEVPLVMGKERLPPPVVTNGQRSPASDRPSQVREQHPGC